MGSRRVQTVAGNGQKGSDYVGGGNNRNQQLNSPWDLAFDAKAKSHSAVLTLTTFCQQLQQCQSHPLKPLGFSSTYSLDSQSPDCKRSKTSSRQTNIASINCQRTALCRRKLSTLPWQGSTRSGGTTCRLELRVCSAEMVQNGIQTAALAPGAPGHSLLACRFPAVEQN